MNQYENSMDIYYTFFTSIYEKKDHKSIFTNIRKTAPYPKCFDFVLALYHKHENDDENEVLISNWSNEVQFTATLKHLDFIMTKILILDNK